MYSPIANTMFSYILTMAEFREAIPEKHRPSWVKITTITMISQFLKEIDIPKLKQCFSKLGSITLKPEGSTREGGFVWEMKETAFYNQITIGYFDGYQSKYFQMEAFRWQGARTCSTVTESSSS
jgi:hypothetical protein